MDDVNIHIEELVLDGNVNCSDAIVDRISEQTSGILDREQISRVSPEIASALSAQTQGRVIRS